MLPQSTCSGEAERRRKVVAQKLSSSSRTRCGGSRAGLCDTSLTCAPRAIQSTSMA
ncbi:MAG: hypothetical protein ACLU37_07155 [Collinsella sp.]